MDKLGLYGMKATFDELIATGIKQRATPEKILLDMLTAELAERRIRSIRYRMSQARFPVDKDLDHFDFEGSPVMNRRFVRSTRGASLPTRVTSSWLVAPAQARRTWPLQSPGRPSETANGAATSTC